MVNFVIVESEFFEVEFFKAAPGLKPEGFGTEPGVVGGLEHLG